MSRIIPELQGYTGHGSARCLVLLCVCVFYFFLFNMRMQQKSASDYLNLQPSRFSVSNARMNYARSRAKHDRAPAAFVFPLQYGAALADATVIRDIQTNVSVFFVRSLIYVVFFVCCLVLFYRCCFLTPSFPLKRFVCLCFSSFISLFIYILVNAQNFFFKGNKSTNQYLNK